VIRDLSNKLLDEAIEMESLSGGVSVEACLSWSDGSDVGWG